MPPLRYFSILFFFSGFLMSTKAQTTEQISSFPIRVVVIGSSTAEGIGASTPDSSWVALFRAYLQALHPDNEVINLGLGGYSSYQLLPSGSGPFRARPVPDPERNITRAMQFHPQVVIVNLPSNDTVSGHSEAEQEDNFNTIITTAREGGAFVWICTTQPRNLPPEQIEAQMAIRDMILARYDEFGVDVWHPLAGPDNHLLVQYDSGDGTHLNDAGHRVLFEAMVAKNIPDRIQLLVASIQTASAAIDASVRIGCSPLGWLGGWIKGIWKH
ncbi:MAG: SGNH/GDSL hydrolase family protein [Lewinellaceae bacterium]|nr:SGNH/GDSL hydrolase family protein [Lewinellaceae bacterium]